MNHGLPIWVSTGSVPPIITGLPSLSASGAIAWSWVDLIDPRNATNSALPASLLNASTTHYYISSLKSSAQQLGQLIRRHWAIENELHLVLDVTFGEDANRTRDRNASANLGIVRRTALSLLKQAPGKQSKPTKIVKAGGDPAFLKTVLVGNSVI